MARLSSALLTVVPHLDGRMGVQKADTVHSPPPPKSPPKRHYTREAGRGSSPPKQRATVHPALVLAGRYAVKDDGGAAKWWEETEYLNMTWHPAEGPLGVINAKRDPHPDEVWTPRTRPGGQTRSLRRKSSAHSCSWRRSALWRCERDSRQPRQV